MRIFDRGKPRNEIHSFARCCDLAYLVGRHTALRTVPCSHGGKTMLRGCPIEWIEWGAHQSVQLDSSARSLPKGIGCGKRLLALRDPTGDHVPSAAQSTSRSNVTRCSHVARVAGVRCRALWPGLWTVCGLARHAVEVGRYPILRD